MYSYLAEQEENFSFWKNLIMVALFFVVTPVALATSLFSLVSLSKNQAINADMAKAPLNLIVEPKAGVRVYASLPNSFPEVSEQLTAADARPIIIKNYLEAYRSPLAPYFGLLVQTADKYNLDFRLLTAIAQQESNLCKIIPPGGHNCWGWGIHSEGTLGFSSYEEGIETVSRGLRENYFDFGLTTPDTIMTKYTPLSNGSWAFGVNEFMKQME